MPIQLTCACGKTLRVKDEMRGKKARCPGCQAVLTIPVDGDPAPPPAPPPPPPSGKKSLPPPPPPSEGMSETKVPARSRPTPPSEDDREPKRRPRDEDDEPDDRDAPRRVRRFRDEEDEGRPKKKRGSMGLILGLLGGAAVLLLGCCGGVGFWFYRATRPEKLEFVNGTAKASGSLVSLNTNDPKAKEGRAYLVQLEAGKKYQMTLTSKEFAPSLRLESTEGVKLEDSSFGDGNTARLFYRCQETKEYKLYAVAIFGAGTYDLTVQEATSTATPLTFAGGKATAKGTLSQADPERDPKRNSPCKTYSVTLEKGKVYRIDHRRTEGNKSNLDPYLRLEGPDGKQIAENDDSGLGRDSRILFTCQQDGEHTIYATALGSHHSGAYELTVEAMKMTPAGPVTLVAGRALLTSWLLDNDPKDSVRQGPSKIFTLKMVSGKRYQIWMRNKQTFLNSYLRLEGPDGKTLVQDDDGGGFPNAFITYDCKQAGEHRIHATTSGNLDRGEFELEIVERVPQQTMPLTLVGGRSLVTGRFQLTDEKDPQRQTPAHFYTVQMEMGKSYQIDLRKKDGSFDPFLILRNAQNIHLLSDDDGGGFPNARIIYRPLLSGVYGISATQLRPEVGSYELEVQEQGVVKGPGPKGKVLTLTNGKAEVTDQLRMDDGHDPLRKQPAKLYTVFMKQGKTYKIDHMSKEFDAYLRLVDATGNQLAQDDDGGDGNNSRIRHACTKNGFYRIYASALIGGQGNFQLTIQEE